jgi:hypothetical protein
MLRKEFTEGDLIEHLKYNAEMLKHYGKDIIEGDFTVFPLLHKICAERIAPHKKELYKNLTDEQRKMLE